MSDDTPLSDDDHGDILAALGFADTPVAKSGKSVQKPPTASDLENETGRIGRSAADVLGLPDAMRALRGQMTPEEAQHFAMTSALGLIPGGEGENLLTRGASKLASKASVLPHMGELESAMENLMGRPGYYANKAVAKNALLGDQPEGAFYGNTGGSWGAYAKSPYAYTAEKISKAGGSYIGGLPNYAKNALTDSDIDKALAKNPGASIFDVAGTHIGGPSNPYMPSAYTSYAPVPLKTFADIPREAVPHTPVAASIMGRSENLVHGTRMGPLQWETPSGGSLGTDADALKLPDDELGVHFGNPRQAQEFTGFNVNDNTAPRHYPVVVATNNTLRMPDLGTWHIDKVAAQLAKQFPDDKNLINQMDDIGDARNYLNSKGYDSVVYTNRSEDPGHDSYIKFTPSPVAPQYVAGVRSPFAKFDPNKLAWPELAAGLMATAGAGAAAGDLLSDDQGNTIIPTR